MKFFTLLVNTNLALITLLGKQTLTVADERHFVRRATESSASSPNFITHFPEFLEVIGDNPKFSVLAETDAHEGPVYVESENSVYFVTGPRPSNVPIFNGITSSVNKLNLDDLTVSTVIENCNNCNGMSSGGDNRLLIGEQGSMSEDARISSYNIRNGRTTTVVDNFRGLPFNSLNDVVTKSDGTIWFTDPSYGFNQGFRAAPLLGEYVYRYDPETEEITVVADSFNMPNGLAFSPDESLLYINDSGAIQEGASDFDIRRPHHIKVFDVINNRSLANERLFALITPGIPDGIKVDTEGRVYSSSQGNLQVFDTDGRLIGEIVPPTPSVTNFVFGGPDNNILYIVDDTAVYSAEIAAVGAV